MKKSIISSALIIAASLITATSFCIAQTNVFPPDGNTGVGTTTPSVKLEVVGDIKADAIVFPDGTFQTTAPADSFSSIKIGANSLFISSNGIIRVEKIIHQ